MRYALLGAALLVACATTRSARAADQAAPGAANADAVRVAESSPLVRASLEYLAKQARAIRDRPLRDATIDAMENPRTCVRHRASLSESDKKAILDRLLAEGLYAPADAAAFPGGAAAGVFPPLLEDGSACPKLPQRFGSAPGSASGGHHSFPGGLAVHESFNERSIVSLAENYARNYRVPGSRGGGEGDARGWTGLDEDVLRAAPIWHDWAKTMVLQWNADGTEFKEFTFGGNGATDAFGGAGDSRTGGHHVLGVAEAMARGFAPDVVIAQACAHSAPMGRNEFKVVNWLRAAAILARVDPVAKGYLYVDGAGHLRLPQLRAVSELNPEAATLAWTNFLPEYAMHNLSDADFTFTGAAVTQAEALLRALAARYGYDPADVARYNWAYRNTAFAHLSAERIAFLYQRGGLGAVRKELDHLRARRVL